MLCQGSFSRINTRKIFKTLFFYTSLTMSSGLTISSSSSSFSSSFSSISLPDLDSSSYLSALDASALDTELMGGENSLFSLEQLMELAGLAVAQCVHRSFYIDSPLKILIIAGPGNNGGDGLVAGRHLLSFKHDVTIVSIRKRTLTTTTTTTHFDNLEKQVEFFGGKVIRDHWPIDWSAEFITSSFDICVDAIFGFSFKGNVREPWINILQIISKANKPLQNQLQNSTSNDLAVDGSMFMKSNRLKILSIDIPSGYEVEGRSNFDSESDLFFPDVLISLTAPKEVAVRIETDARRNRKMFSHWLGGRFVPQCVMEKFGLGHLLKLYKGDEQIIQLR